MSRYTARNTYNATVSRPNGTATPQLGPNAAQYAAAAQLAMNHLQKIFGTSTLYLEPGPTNRLVLALRSGLADEQDFALERLLYITQLDVDLVPLAQFPGLAEALLQIVSDSCQFENQNNKPAWLQSLGHTHAHEQVKRRAVDAAVILRNLALESKNYAILVGSIRNIIQLCLAVFDGSYFDWERTSEESIEIQLTMLDILEVVSPEIKLGQDPSSSKSSNATNDTSSLDLLPVLAKCCYSQDRSLILAAYRVLASLAGSDNVASHNLQRLNTATRNTVEKRSNPIHRAFELLPLEDLEVTTAILDLLYSYTQIISNAAIICERPDLLFTFKTLMAKLSIGGKREDFELEPKLTPAEIQAKERQKNEERRDTTSRALLTTKLPPEELHLMLHMREPLRTIRWMQWVFESGPAAEVTQVTLWTAYRDQFESYEATAENKMLAAADVIKHSTDAFSEALPMVSTTEERKFIIKGIQIRDRAELAEELKTRWATRAAAGHKPSVPQMQTGADPIQVYSNQPTALQMNPNLATPIQILQAAMAILLTTGIPPPSSEAFRVERESKTAEPPFIVKYNTWQPQLHAITGFATGPSFLAALVLRNLARAINATVPSKGRETDQMGPNIFALLAGENESTESTSSSTNLSITFKNQERAQDVLLGLENDFVLLAGGNRHFSPYFGEVLAAASAIREHRKISGTAG